MIDYEPKAQLQVPLLLRLGEEQAALKKAVESGNTDLVYTVILHLREHMPLSDFQVNNHIYSKKKSYQIEIQTREIFFRWLSCTVH